MRSDGYDRGKFETAVRRAKRVMLAPGDRTTLLSAGALSASSLQPLPRFEDIERLCDPDCFTYVRRIIDCIARMIGLTPRSAPGGDGNNRFTTPDDLDRWIRRFATDVEGEPPRWTFRFDGMEAFCQCQQNVDRMRIVAPVCTVQELGVEAPLYFKTMLEANYHSALDPRYALEQGIVMSAFLHPLRPLTEDQFQSALQQVIEMVRTFGDSFSSSGIVFGPRSS